ncbi:MAG: hypothetical protein FJX03_08235 [Alphaproteobacteria bacterium]|nr:hypothetical protein [Alphaproteobacteria bacterium]
MTNKRRHIPLRFDIEIPNSVDFEGMIINSSGYFVRLSEFAKQSPPILEISFPGRVLAQRIADEGIFLSMSWDSEGRGPIVILENSDFTHWFHKESLGIHEDEDLYTVAILTVNEWIEVITYLLPTAAWIDGS